MRKNEIYSEFAGLKIQGANMGLGRVCTQKNQHPGVIKRLKNVFVIFSPIISVPF